MPGSLALECGSRLENPQIAYRLLGPPNAPVIVVLGGISASRFVWQPPTALTSGWWQELIGPGLILDTHQYRILSLDYLGGNGDSESPRNSELGGADFPAISSRDQAQALAALAAHLGIQSFDSVIGASYGGMVALALGEACPELVRRMLVICAAHQAWPLATGWRHVQRELVRFALRHNDVETGLKLARALAMTTYRSGLEFAQRFAPGFTDQAESECVNYLERCGEKFSQIFDPYAYLCLSRSIDAHNVDPTRISVPVDLLGFSSDQLVPPSQVEQLHSALPAARRLTMLDTLFGHDAFLTEDDLMIEQIKIHLEYCQ